MSKNNLSQLLEDLYSAHAAHRRKAIKFLGERGDKDDLKLLQGYLDNITKELSLLKKAINKLKKRLK